MLAHQTNVALVEPGNGDLRSQLASFYRSSATLGAVSKVRLDQEALCDRKIEDGSKGKTVTFADVNEDSTSVDGSDSDTARSRLRKQTVPYYRHPDFVVGRKRILTEKQRENKLKKRLKKQEKRLNQQRKLQAFIAAGPGVTTRSMARRQQANEDTPLVDATMHSSLRVPRPLTKRERKELAKIEQRARLDMALENIRKGGRDIRVVDDYFVEVVNGVSKVLGRWEQVQLKKELRIRYEVEAARLAGRDVRFVNGETVEIVNGASVVLRMGRGRLLDPQEVELRKQRKEQRKKERIKAKAPRNLRLMDVWVSTAHSAPTIRRRSGPRLFEDGYIEPHGGEVTEFRKQGRGEVANRKDYSTLGNYLSGAPEIEVYTDGSLRGPSRDCAIGCFFPNKERCHISRVVPGTSSMDAEVQACTAALRAIGDGVNAIIHVDCLSVITAMQTAASGTPAQTKYTSELAKIMLTRSGGTRWKWVKAHVGNRGNTEADKLAGMAAIMWSMRGQSEIRRDGRIAHFLTSEGDKRSQVAPVYGVSRAADTGTGISMSSLATELTVGPVIDNVMKASTTGEENKSTMVNVEVSAMEIVVDNGNATENAEQDSTGSDMDLDSDLSSSDSSNEDSEEDHTAHTMFVENEDGSFEEVLVDSKGRPLGTRSAQADRETTPFTPMERKVDGLQETPTSTTNPFRTSDQDQIPAPGNRTIVLESEAEQPQVLHDEEKVVINFMPPVREVVEHPSSGEQKVSTPWDHGDSEGTVNASRIQMVKEPAKLEDELREKDVVEHETLDRATSSPILEPHDADSDALNGVPETDVDWDKSLQNFADDSDGDREQRDHFGSAICEGDSCKKGDDQPVEVNGTLDGEDDRSKSPSLLVCPSKPAPAESGDPARSVESFESLHCQFTNLSLDKSKQDKQQDSADALPPLREVNGQSPKDWEWDAQQTARKSAKPDSEVSADLYGDWNVDVKSEVSCRDLPHPGYSDTVNHSVDPWFRGSESPTPIIRRPFVPKPNQLNSESPTARPSTNVLHLPRIPLTVTELDLYLCFRPYGKIENMLVYPLVGDLDSAEATEPHHHAYVQFAEIEAALAAYTHLACKISFKTGETLAIEYASVKPTPMLPPRSKKANKERVWRMFKYRGWDDLLKRDIKGW
ncbi:hypothetical protein SpCBS45565_g02047 [Spizellomyces sp. 'palustris']|nr:hypothetical protein SpCBS45565_g02047 [Spizellomyces sp. 'palustris']